MALVRCRECNSKISSKAAACPQCGAPLKPAKRQSKPVGCCGGIVAVGLILFIFVIVAGIMDRDRVNPGGVAQPGVTNRQGDATSLPRATVLAAGEVVTLDDGDSLCTIAVDDAAWNEMLSLQNAHGDLMPLVHAKRVLPAPKGSKAKIISTALLSCKIQLMDGPYEGSTGWIQREFLKK